MDVNTTIQTWINVLTHPGEQPFIEEQNKPQANFTTAIIWMVITGAITGIMGWLAFRFLLASGNAFLPMIDQMNLPPEAAEQMRQMLSSGMMGAMMGGAGLSAIISTPVFFLIGAGILYLIGRLLGGTGDLGRYAYLLATFQAPIGIINALLGLIPGLGGCLSFLLAIYSLVLTYFATKIGLNLSSGKAIAVIVIPLGIVLLIMLCIIISVIGLFVTVQNQ